MIKKIISAVLVCAFGILLFGCGSSEKVQMQEAKEVVADYFEDLKSAQFEKASDYVSSDYKDPLRLEEIEPALSGLMLGMNASMNTGEEFKKSFHQFMDVVMNQIVNTYDIEKAKWQKEGVVDVQVNFEGKDLASFDPADLDEDANTYMESYLVENQDRLTALYEEKGEQEAYKVILDEGEQEAYKVILDELSKPLFELLEKHVKEDLPDITHKVRLRVEKQNDEWLITKSEIMN